MGREARRDLPDHQRRLYSLTRAIGRFGMRIFPPRVMESAHWHGHVELNHLTGASMTYDVDGRVLQVPPQRLVAFWAGIPHQLTEVVPTGDGPVRLANIYLPLDAFLAFTHIAEFQVALIGGGFAALPGQGDMEGQIERWYRDYRTGGFERIDLVKMELNALFRRAQLDGPTFLIEPEAPLDGRPGAGPEQTRHVVAMLRYILENLDQPISNGDIASAAGLNENYALTLFSGTMRMPTKQFVIRMRLLRARALLLESKVPVGRVAELTGFSSSTQFFHHFKSKYGVTPNQLRTGAQRPAGIGDRGN